MKLKECDMVGHKWHHVWGVEGIGNICSVGKKHFTTLGYT